MALENNKSVLIYGLSIDEKMIINNILEKNNLPPYILLEKHMAKMKMKEILSGLRFQLNVADMPEDKIILFNNFSDEELTSLIKDIRKELGKAPILAVITDISREWDFETLLAHLIEEREAYKLRVASKK